MAAVVPHGLHWGTLAQVASMREHTDSHLVLSAPTHLAPYLTHHTISNPPAWRGH